MLENPRLFTIYPKFLCELLESLFTVGDKPKASLYRTAMQKARKYVLKWDGFKDFLVLQADVDMKVEEKIALDAIKNDRESHIKLDQRSARSARSASASAVCPGHLYSLNDETGEMVVEYAGCLECGTCMIACTCGAVSWNIREGSTGCSTGTADGQGSIVG